jgi:hypothetical protein
MPARPQALLGDRPTFRPILVKHFELKLRRFRPEAMNKVLIKLGQTKGTRISTALNLKRTGLSILNNHFRSIALNC